MSTGSQKTPIRLCRSLITNKNGAYVANGCAAFRIPINSPVSHSHIWNHKRFLESTPQGFSQRRALRDFYGRNLPEKPASSLPFCRPARTLAMAKQPSFPQHRPSFSSRRHTVCSYSRASHSTSPIFQSLAHKVKTQPVPVSR